MSTFRTGDRVQYARRKITCHGIQRVAETGSVYGTAGRNDDRALVLRDSDGRVGEVAMGHLRLIKTRTEECA